MDIIRNLAANYLETASIILYGIGMLNLMLHKHLVKKIIGFNIMEVAPFLFLTARGYITGRHAPIIVNDITHSEYYINPLPGGLVLTGIVVGVSVTAFLLSLCLKAYQYYGTIDTEEMTELEGGED